MSHQLRALHTNGCGGRAGAVELLTGIEGVSGWPVRTESSPSGAEPIPVMTRAARRAGCGSSGCVMKRHTHPFSVASEHREGREAAEEQREAYAPDETATPSAPPVGVLHSGSPA